MSDQGIERHGDPAHVRLLVVDDDPHDQMLFYMALRDCDERAEVDFANDGQAAMDVLTEQASAGRLPDVVILDLRMPKLGGHDTLQQIRQNPQLAELDAVIFSSSHRQSEIRRSIAEGALWHEVKPSTYADLVAFVEQVIGRVRQSRAEVSAG